MRRRLLTTLAAVLVTGLLCSPLWAQGQLSVQVLQLLTRVNTWVGTQSFQDLRVPLAAIPSVTTARIYTDLSGNLYFNGGLIAGSGGTLPPHNLLSTTHADTLASAPVRGGVIVANSTPAWAQLALCTSGQVLESNGTDTVCSFSGASLTNLPAANLTGTIAAISGANLTNLNASALTSGTVPIAQLSGITNAQIANAAAIAYSKLNLAGSVLNSDISAGTLTNAAINASAGIVYSKLNLAASVLFSDLASNSCTLNQIPKWNGAAWACAADANSGGTATSVALSAPAMFTVTGSPVTTSGTLTLTLATQTANTVFAGPTSGGAVAPAFRALVNADLPLSGASAGTFSKVTINTAGVVTLGATANLSTDITGTLPVANGGTNLTSATSHTTMVGNGTTWVSKTIPDCQTGSLAYTQSTDLFSCVTGGTAHNLLSATHSDTVAASVTRGAIIVGNSTPAWARVVVGAAGTLVSSNGTDTSFSSTIGMGTITASTPLALTQTWNAGGTTFTAFQINATNTASAAGSLLIDAQVGGSSQWNADKAGNLNSLGNLWISTAVPTISSGFGGSPSIAGKAHAFRVTLGSAPGTSGVVAFNATYANAPVCSAVDETLAANGSFEVVNTTPTTTQVTLTYPSGVSASDKIGVRCEGF